jgi:hypothetical protein
LRTRGSALVQTLAGAAIRGIPVAVRPLSPFVPQSSPARDPRSPAFSLGVPKWSVFSKVAAVKTTRS